MGIVGTYQPAFDRYLAELSDDELAALLARKKEQAKGLRQAHDDLADQIQLCVWERSRRKTAAGYRYDFDTLSWVKRG